MQHLRQIQRVQCSKGFNMRRKIHELKKEDIFLAVYYFAWRGKVAHQPWHRLVHYTRILGDRVSKWSVGTERVISKRDKQTIALRMFFSDHLVSSIYYTKLQLTFQKATLPTQKRYSSTFWILWRISGLGYSTIYVSLPPTPVMHQILISISTLFLELSI